MLNPQTLRPKVVTTHESAARTQLETAIFLWFVEGDPLSIHTLAAAALQRLHDQGTKIGKPSVLLSMFNELSKKKRSQATLPTTFAKHADRRMPHDGVEFWSEYTDHWIYDAIVCYGEQFHKLTAWMRLFAMRMTLVAPKTFGEIQIVEDLLERLPRHEYFARLGRHEFAQEVLPLLTREDLGMPPTSPS